MMTLEEYLENPCRKSSVPYWKAKHLVIPETMRVVHEDHYRDQCLDGYRDEPYFRLMHHLTRIERTAPDGFCVRTAEPSDLPVMVDIIRRSYSDLSVSYEQIAACTRREVYDGTLWILVSEVKTNRAVGCGIGDYDREAREGILEWIQVLPEYRCRGIGQMMVNELLDRMKQADFATVSGKANNPTNPERLYRRCGFTGADIWHVLTKRDKGYP